MRLVHVSARGVGGCTPLSVVTEIAVHSDPVQNRLPEKKSRGSSKKEKGGRSQTQQQQIELHRYVLA
jgi:hypothetical protein